MAKYLWLGIIIIILGVSGTLIWHAQSADDCGRLKGMEGRNIYAADMMRWKKDSDNVLLDSKRGCIYMQEAIGSTGAGLTSPKFIDGNFILSFELKSFTRAAVFNLKSVNNDGSEGYVLELSQLPQKTIVKLHQNGKVLQEARFTTLEPDKYYHFVLERIGNRLSLDINNMPVIQLDETTPAPAARISFIIRGQPDHPAAIAIRQMKLYQ